MLCLVSNFILRQIAIFISKKILILISFCNEIFNILSEHLLLRKMVVSQNFLILTLSNLFIDKYSVDDNYGKFLTIRNENMNGY